MKNKYISKTDKLFISGANGMVGSAISRFLKKTDFELINKKNLLIPSRKDLDLSDPYQVNLWFKKIDLILLLLQQLKLEVSMLIKIILMNS